MKRSPLPKRKKPLARSTKPPKRSPLPKATKPIRAKKRKPFAPKEDAGFVAWIHEQPCVVAHRVPVFPIEAAHVKSRGAGGKIKGNLVPLCWAHHREQHNNGIRSFEAWHGVSLKALALELANRYDREVSRDR